MANVFTQDAQQAPYDHFDITETWRYRSGLVQMAVAATPAQSAGVRTPCELVRVHQPFGTVVVKFEAVRTGAKPRLPSPVPSDGNRTLLDALVVTGVPARLADGTPVYRSAGTYVYALTLPLVPALDTVPAPEGPYVVSGATANAVDPSLFDSTLVG